MTLPGGRRPTRAARGTCPALGLAGGHSAVEDQAADRAHRLGQTRPVLVHRLVAQDTVEERILALQERKRILADAALEGADRTAAITREELLTLLT